MAKYSTRRKEKPAGWGKGIATLFRFRDQDHVDAVREAVKASGLCLNTWLIDVTLAAARKQLAKLK